MDPNKNILSFSKLWERNLTTNIKRNEMSNNFNLKYMSLFKAQRITYKNILSEMNGWEFMSVFILYVKREGRHTGIIMCIHLKLFTLTTSLVGKNRRSYLL